MRIKRLLLAIVPVLGTSLGGVGAKAQTWLLNASESRFYMQTAKANAVMETHRFTGLDGNVARDGAASVKIDLTSVASGVDVRDVRMRYLLFETFKFPHAEVTARLDMPKLTELLANTRAPYDLTFTLSLHGVSREIETPVTLTRVSDKSVSVASAKPVIVKADDFDLLPGLVKLSEAVNGTPIVSAASITFDLLFETGEQIPELETARAEAERRRAAAESALISPEGCETRINVISAARAIYFKTGSVELDKVNEPLLTSIADIARRCPTIKFEVGGHTDNAGVKAANQRLSEQRASAVVAALVHRGVGAERMKAVGYGNSKPIAPNATDADRAKNRRIEFRVQKD